MTTPMFRYNHRTVTERMNRLRAMEAKKGRAPLAKEAAKILSIPESSASGYVAALVREQRTRRTIHDAAVAMGVSARRARKLIQVRGTNVGIKTAQAWRFSDEEIERLRAKRGA
mgnify:FL=1